MLVLGRATSEHRQSQSAADAAALTAMDTTATAWMEILRGEGFAPRQTFGSGSTDRVTPCSGSSLPDAQLLAQRNHTHLEQCSWNPATGEVSLRVVATGSHVSDARARAQARAALTVDLRSCTLSGDVAEPRRLPLPVPILTRSRSRSRRRSRRRRRSRSRSRAPSRSPGGSPAAPTGWR